MQIVPGSAGSAVLSIGMCIGVAPGQWNSGPSGTKTHPTLWTAGRTLQRGSSRLRIRAVLGSLRSSTVRRGSAAVDDAVPSSRMRGLSLLLVAAGLGCSFETNPASIDSGKLMETGTETEDGSTTQQVTSTTSSTSPGTTGTAVTTNQEPTTSGEADDTDAATAFVQELSVTSPGEYDFEEVPLLVTLGAENTRWDAIEPDLSNLRFVGSAEGSDIELPFEVAQISEDSAQLWVLLPEVSSEADHFRVEYGVGVRSQAWSPGDVWPAYEAVWHLGEDPEDPQPQYLDSSGNDRHITNPANDSIPSEDMVPGIVGRAPRFTQERELQISNADWPESNIGDRFTLEAWVQYEDTPPNSYRAIIRKSNTYELIGSRNEPDPLERPVWSVYDGSDFRHTAALGESWNQGPGVWNYAAATFERNMAQGQVRTALYLDGVEVATEDSPDYQPAQTQADFRIGSELTAVVDEVRVSFEVRPRSWFELQNRSMRDELLKYGDPTPLE